MPDTPRQSRRPADPDKPSLPIAPPSRKGKKESEHSGEGPDLRFEEIEERHIPKDRNIFDK
ncbi:MAG: hypothetical protein VX916_02520 [Planctomycetota bacterium]|nr:hypothetical protein [Planctomycetota bacterium]